MAQGRDCSGMPNTDTIDKRNLRKEAEELLTILKCRKVEYGAEPERAFKNEAVECAKLGTEFLKLAVTGDHYSTKKYLRAELMKERKKRNDPAYMGHLAEYQDLMKPFFYE